MWSAPPATYGAPASAPPANTYGTAPASAPPATYGTAPASAPPANTYGTAPASAPPATYGTAPASAPPANTYGEGAQPGGAVPTPPNLGKVPQAGSYAARAQVSVPPATGPTSAPPATGIYQAAPPPATGVYQASVPSGAGSQPTGPHYSDLVTMPGDAPPQASAPGGDPGVPTPATPAKSKRGLVLGLVAVVVVFLLAVAGTGIVVALNNAGSTSFAVNSCVKQDGDSAKKASCSDKDAFTIVQKVEKPESCSDAGQPYVVLQHKGQKDEVLCLRPAAQK